MNAPDLVLEALRQPAGTLAWSPAAWDLLVRPARRADLLGRIALLLDREGLTQGVPSAVCAHFEAAIVLTEAQHAEVRREVLHIERALAPLALQPVLLKGAVYLVSGAAAALGRTFDDVDLLVPKARAPEVEAHLMVGGRVGTHLSPWGQR